MGKRHILMEEKFIAERLRATQARHCGLIAVRLQEAITLEQEEAALHRFTKTVKGKEIYVKDRALDAEYVFGDEAIADAFVEQATKQPEVA